MQHGLVELVRRISQSVVIPVTIFARDNQAGATQVRQMPRRLRLRNAKDAHNVANAKLTVSKQIDDAESCLVGQRPEETFNFGADCGHTRKRMLAGSRSSINQWPASQ
jgi:hypothetical protein